MTPSIALPPGISASSTTDASRFETVTGPTSSDFDANDQRLAASRGRAHRRFGDNRRPNRLGCFRRHRRVRRPGIEQESKRPSPIQPRREDDVAVSRFEWRDAGRSLTAACGADANATNPSAKHPNARMNPPVRRRLQRARPCARCRDESLMKPREFGEMIPRVTTHHVARVHRDGCDGRRGDADRAGTGQSRSASAAKALSACSAAGGRHTQSRTRPNPTRATGTCTQFQDYKQVLLHPKEIPYQPWAKAIAMQRRAELSKYDPQGYCMPPSGPRLMTTPFPMEILQMPEQKRIVMIYEGGTHIWRNIYMDGRTASRA